MKRFFIVFTIVITVGIHGTHAQRMQKGMSLFNAGLGLVPGLGLNISYDYGLIDEWGPGIFTIGGYAGFANWGKAYPAKPHYLDYRVNAFAFASRTTYRYAINKQFEVYGVVMLGGVSYSYSAYIHNAIGLFFAVTGGCRYSFNSNITVFAEMGFNEISLLNGGLSFSF